MIRIIKGDCRERLRDLPDESVHCVVTSPPYFDLRDYGMAGQIGIEQTPEEYVDQLVAVFREVRRVLRSDGTLWLNLGDTYGGERTTGRNDAIRHGKPTGGGFKAGPRIKISSGLKAKDLCGIPWRVAFALQADGWWLRQDIIWAKPNPMPESVTDRCTKAHEYIFLLSKNERYFYDAEAVAEDAVREPMPMQASAQAAMLKSLGPMSRGNGINHQFADPTRLWAENGKRNKRSVWTVATQPFREAHFATFPPDLIEPCIKAGCPEFCCPQCASPWNRKWQKEFRGNGHTHCYADWPTVGNKMRLNGKQLAVEHASRPNKFLGFSASCSCGSPPIHPDKGTVLDPFGGAGTTGLVADRLGRNAILIEFNPEYAEMAERRIADDAGMFAQMALGCECVEPKE